MANSSFIPLIPLSLATIAAFGVAIHAQFPQLSILWTSCSGDELPTPLCFAVKFFRTALATSHTARLEQAAIVAFLAGLATITAVEGVRATLPPAAAFVNEKKAPASKPQQVAPPRSSLSARVLNNLTIPWLVYNLALGAFSWQTLIVPAFLRHHKRSTASSPQDTTHLPAAETLAIPLSIATGLLLPSTLLLLSPASTTLIVAFLLFPLAISFTRRATGALFTDTTTRLPTMAIYALPILCSATAHILLLTDFLTGSPATQQPPTRAAMLLLEIDHAAIFATFLYWVFAAAPQGHGLGAVCTTLVVSALLGPGAGVCLGWLWRGEKEEGETRRVRRGKASGHFFGGPLP